MVLRRGRFTGHSRTAGPGRRCDGRRGARSRARHAARQEVRATPDNQTTRLTCLTRSARLTHCIRTHCRATEPSGTTDSAKPTGITGTAEPTGVTDMPDSASRDDTTASAEACYPSAPDGPRSDGPRSDSSAEESRSGQTAASAVPPSDTPPAVPHRHRGALAADALVLMAETLLANTPAFLNSADKYRVIVHLNPAAGPGMFTPAAAIPSADEGTPRPAPHQAAHLDDGIPLAPETADRLACEATVTNLHIGGDGQVHGLGDPTRFPRAATARAVRIRAHHACQAPGCTTRHGLQIHHVRHWCHGGETSLANLVLICRFHHWLVHEGGHTFAARPGATFGFYRPDGTEVPATPSLPGITGAPADSPWTRTSAGAATHTTPAEPATHTTQAGAATHTIPAEPSPTGISPGPYSIAGSTSGEHSVRTCSLLRGGPATRWTSTTPSA